MAVEFRTKDESYKWPHILPSGAEVLDASVFVDHLPPGLATDPYHPYLVTDRYSHRPRYVIDVDIKVNDDCLVLEGVCPKGSIPINPDAVDLIRNTSIERDGLDVLLARHGRQYQGTLHPIPERTAEAQQPDLPRQRPWHP